jgi:hydroxymethylglutaryl-CoA reductase
MGANLANDAAEVLASLLRQQGIDVLGAIVTNFPVAGATTATVRIPVDSLPADSFSDRSDLADRVALLSEWAGWDPLRRATHNKGILNGIIGVWAALYQDTRALDASLLASGRPLATWSRRGDLLVGEFGGTLPCGLRGGTSVHAATTGAFLEMMRVGRSEELAQVGAAVGLLQNLAALLAIATEGIAAGHMRLHRRKSEGVMLGGRQPRSKGRSTSRRVPRGGGK